jgi:hypothetical protein
MTALVPVVVMVVDKSVTNVVDVVVVSLVISAKTVLPGVAP